MRLIDETPRTGIRSSRVAFLHPASTGGVLTEIVQPAEEPTDMSDSPSASPSASTPAAPCPCASPQEKLDELQRLLHGRTRPGSASRGRPTARCSSTSRQVIYLRVESDEQRIGF